MWSKFAMHPSNYRTYSIPRHKSVFGPRWTSRIVQVTTVYRILRHTVCEDQGRPPRPMSGSVQVAMVHETQPASMYKADLHNN